ncbi:hypothetical protein [Microbacterium sp. SS28]|uniref:hypothetical protein n=1 Tax=Microbacterium sp. SS28 TaxID=2919948 RepID=UPI001FA951A8|nr:hypothetical protein [Microbacterium sp. SS28]
MLLAAAVPAASASVVGPGTVGINANLSIYTNGVSGNPRPYGFDGAEFDPTKNFLQVTITSSGGLLASTPTTTQLNGWVVLSATPTTAILQWPAGLTGFGVDTTTFTYPFTGDAAVQSIQVKGAITATTATNFDDGTVTGPSSDIFLPV